MSADRSPLRAVIADDESLARSYLRELLAKGHPQVQVVAESKNGFEAVRAVAEHKPDLLFLDIQMPKLDGFEVLELLEGSVAVVFVTAYDQYAMKAFDAHAIDYLLKPFSAQRLAEAIGKVERNLGRALPEAAVLRQAARAPGKPQRRVVVRDKTGVVILLDDQIDYVQAEDDYVAIHSQGRAHLKHQTIESLTQALDPIRFVRIHRSTLINVDRLARIEPFTKDRHLAILKDGTRLDISREGHARLKAALGS